MINLEFKKITNLGGSGSLKCIGPNVYYYFAKIGGCNQELIQPPSLYSRFDIIVNLASKFYVSFFINRRSFYSLLRLASSIDQCYKSVLSGIKVCYLENSTCFHDISIYEDWPKLLKFSVLSKKIPTQKNSYAQCLNHY
jgi:hypothetical protein